jgi:hypothetical protein
VKKLPVIAVAAAVIIPLLALAGPTYQRMMVWRLEHAARGAARQGQDLEANRLYCLALQRDSSNAKVLREYADYLGRHPSPMLLQVRERIHQLEPENLQAYFDCVESALICQKPQEARALLTRGAPTKARESAQFYHLLSVSYFITKDYPQADAANVQALRREPANKDFLANQACIRLCSPDPEVHQSARSALLAYLTDPDQGRTALQALLLDAAELPPKEPEPAWLAGLLAEGQKSLVPEDAHFPDYLSALRRWRPKEFAPHLAEYLHAAIGEHANTLFAQRWLAAEHLYQEQLDFRPSLPPAIRDNGESLLYAAEAMFQLHQTDQLQSFLSEPVWAAYPAFARAWKERLRRGGIPVAEDDPARVSSWHKVLNSADDVPDILFTLSRLTLDWGWTPEYEETLWQLSAGRSRLSQDALHELSAYYLAKGDTPDILRVLKRQLVLDPEDPVARNNFAYASFLLERESAAATKIAEELCHRYPESPAFAATRAFGLFKSGKIAAALQSLEHFPPERWRDTPQGVTYGFLLAANGDPHALEFLKDATRWVHFPEERELIAESTAKIGR